MINFGWNKTKSQEAQEWATFSNGDVIAFEEDIEKLIQGAIKVDDIDLFLVKNNKLYKLYQLIDAIDDLREVTSLKEGIKFKKLWSVKL